MNKLIAIRAFARTQPFKLQRLPLYTASLTALALAGCGGNDTSVAPEPVLQPAVTTASVLTGSAASVSVGGGVNLILNGESAYKQVAQSIHLAYFVRPPLPSELNATINALKVSGVAPNIADVVAAYGKNADITQLIDSLSRSTESKLIYGGLAKDVTASAFLNLLGRKVDVETRDQWAVKINNNSVPRLLAPLAILSSAAGDDRAVAERKLQVSTRFTDLLISEALAVDSTRTWAGRTLINGVTPSSTTEAVNNQIAWALSVVSPPINPAVSSAPPAGSITDVIVESTKLTAQTNVPVTFGQVFSVGHLHPAQRLVGILANGQRLPLQTDVKATHPDGSVRHAIISAVVPSLAINEGKRIYLVKDEAAADINIGVNSLSFKTFSQSKARVEIKLDGVDYTADLSTAASRTPQMQWLNGPLVTEKIVEIPLKSSSGVQHPHLQVRYAVRDYGTQAQQRFEVVVENTRTFTPHIRNYTYNVRILHNDRAVYSQDALTHYHHSRWRKTFWSTPSEPEVHIRHNTSYLIASRAVSNYDQSIVPTEHSLEYMARTYADNGGPMKVGGVGTYMPSTGGRNDIGPLPAWSVSYLLSQDRRAKAAMLAAADGSGTWSIHYRDENTDHPVRLDNPVNRNLSTHGNLAKKGPLPIPRCYNNDWSFCKSPYVADVAHQPSLVYLPYLVTGEYYYLEELQFWASSNPLETAPDFHGFELGLLAWNQVRGQAWGLRTLGHTAYATPDAHPMKSYFLKQLDNNLTFYHNTYVVANPNALGMYDGSGTNDFSIGIGAPWEDDFLTWSFGYLAELGFTRATPIFEWKAKFPIGRMTAPGYCWIEAVPYRMVVRDANGAMLKSFAEVFDATFGDGAATDGTLGRLVHPQGLPYRGLECGSQAQADWRTATGGKWLKGQMIGYATSVWGFPSNMQPALALAAKSGLPNASKAWATFDGRGVKPNYATGAQFAIIPR